MKDFFKPLPHNKLSKRYFISRDGVVFSKYDNKDNLLKEPRVRKTQIQKNGYERCYINWQSKSGAVYANVWIHQAVCRAFHGPRPSGLYEVAHIDGDKLNNKAENLRWATKKENEADKKIHGTAMIRDKNHQTKIDSRMQKAISYLIKHHELTQADLAKAFGVSYQAIGRANKLFIEEIKKECVKHEPRDEDVSIYSGKCKHCGIELVASWEAKK